MSQTNKVYDAILIGTGGAGGWAAKVLAERGLEILVLEAGPQLDPTKDFTNHAQPYEMKYRGFGQPGERERTQWNQWTANEYSKQLYVKDTEHPYTTPEGKPFRWVRSRFVGGKLLHWGRNARRLSDYDFRAADRDGYGENWPIRYADLARITTRLRASSASPLRLKIFLICRTGSTFLPCPSTAVKRLSRKLHQKWECA